MRDIEFRFWNKKNQKMSKEYGLGIIWEDLNNEWGAWEWLWEDIVKLQYIRFRDKNNKKIFEGDLVLAPYTYVESDGYKKKGFPDKIYKLHEVKYSESCPEFFIKELYTLKEYELAEKEYSYRQMPYLKSNPKRKFWTEKDGFMANYWHYDKIKHIEGDDKYLVILDLEVIGNIYENPELLKEQING